MLTFLNIPFLDPDVLIKCLHTIVVCFRTMCSYSDQIEYVEHNNASFEGEFDAKMNSFKSYQMVFVKFL